MTGTAGLTLITGASSGIGEALARVFAANGHPLILSGRSQQRLDALADAIEIQTGHRPIAIAHELAETGAGLALAAELARRQLTPRFIVNSAGNGLFGRAERLNIEAQAALISLNCGALTEITLALLPGAIAQAGGILNVGSVGGFFPGPGMAVYFATKAYVQSFTQALRAEHAGTPLRVSALCPGPVATRFQARARMIAPATPKLLRHDIDAIARAGYRGLMRNRAVVVPGIFNRVMVLLAGLIFHRASAPFVRLFHFGRPRRTMTPAGLRAAPDNIYLEPAAVRPADHRKV